MRKTSVIKLLGAAVLLGALIFLSGSPVFKMLRETLILGLTPLMRLTRIISATGEPPELSVYQDKIKMLTFEEQKLEEENNRLRRALLFNKEPGLSMRGARVILYSRELGREYLIIDAGLNQGVLQDDWVINSERAFLGTVIEVGNSFSKISIASNPDSVFKAEVIPGNIPVISRGLGGRSLSLELIPKEAPIRRGDFVVATGWSKTTSPAPDLEPGRTGRFYLILGEVVNIEDSRNSLLKEARAVLLARPETLNEVFVVRREPGI